MGCSHRTLNVKSIRLDVVELLKAWQCIVLLCRDT